MSVWALIETMLPALSVSERQTLRACLIERQPQTWEKGCYLSVEGQPFAQMILIQTGLIRSFYVDDDTEVNLRFLCDGSLAVPFAAIAQQWINPTPVLLATESLQCVTAVTGYILPVQVLLDRCGFPELERLRSELAARHYLALEQRLRMIQHQRAIDRYRKFLAWMPSPVIEAMPNFHVASYLGMSPEAFSRVKQQLKAQPD